MRSTLRRLALACLVSLPLASPAGGQGRGSIYFPGPGDDWQRRTPAQAGMDSAGIAEAIRFAIENESKAPRDLETAHYQTFGREPHGEGVGPFQPRGDPTGIILRGGRIVAEWGDPHAVEMTFSVTKSFLSTTVGVAVDRGMIRSVHDPVAPYVGPVF
ncbi:MAG TPA: hypothetical protein VF625_15415, partial [Longimicrobium sp.]